VPHKNKRTRHRPPQAGRGDAPQAAELRIIGGVHARRKLHYVGDPRTRPMKDRVREAVFNLVGPAVKGTHAIDLFAGTGALGLEAISRGAARATFFERHFPTADCIRGNISALRVEEACQVVAADTFLAFRRERDLGAAPWLVFCSPPYDFYVDRLDEMLALLRTLVGRAPPGSILVVEADARFDCDSLPGELRWDVREYPPARIAVGRREAD
jgi:16S rRNA (guanine966-N2)-methyltransferase